MPIKTVGSYRPRAPTLFEYSRRTHNARCVSESAVAGAFMD